MLIFYCMLKYECMIKNIYNSFIVFMNDFIYMYVFGNNNFLLFL